LENTEKDTRKQAEEPQRPLELLVDNLISFADAYFRLIKLEFRNGIAIALSLLLVSLTIVSLAVLSILFLSIGFAFWLAETKALGLFGGFGIVAAFYFLVLLAVIGLRKKIKAALDNFIENVIKKTE